MGGGLLLLLCNISLITIGFSSWITNTITNIDLLNTNLAFGSIKNKDYFTIKSINMFSLGPDGLVEDNTIVSSSKIEITFIIDNKRAYDNSNNGLINFETTLTCTDSNFLSSYINGPTVENSTKIESTFTDASLISKVAYQIESLGETKVNLSYLVNDKVDADGKYIADLYYATKPSFSFSIKDVSYE